jgi:hypothetical protein
MDSPQDRQPPRLQDTTERSALPLPLPGSEADPPGARQWEPPLEARGREAPGDPAPIEPPEEGDAGREDAPAPGAAEPVGVPPAEPEAAAEDAAPEPDAPLEPDAAPEPDAGQDTTPAAAPQVPPYEPAPAVADLSGDGAQAGGGRPELLLGAAFLGGLALAFLVKRIGS